MGRTLHYSFDLKTPLPFELQKKIVDITEEYNTKYTWTCENVGFSNMNYFPNWEYFKKLVGENCPHKDIWAMIDKEYKALEKKGMHSLEIMASLYRKGFIKYHYGADPNGFPNAQKFHGFTKTRGNEWNSLLVVSYIVAISKVVPTASISIHDEGEFLFLPIKVRNGKATIDVRDVKSSLRYWIQSWMEDGGKANSNYLGYITELQQKMKQFGITMSYDYEPYNSRRLTSNWGGKKTYKKEVKYRLTNFVFRGNRRRTVGEFCRKVNKADFENHAQFKTIVLGNGQPLPTGAAGNVMEGFYGEYWNKNHERVELESEIRNHFIMNLLNGIMGKDDE